MSNAKRKVSRKGLLLPKLLPSPLLDAANRETLDVAQRSPAPASSVLSSVLGLLRLGIMLFRFRMRKVSDDERAHRLRVYIEDQGGVWIKVGQLLSFRRDLFPHAYIDEFARLQDRGAALRWDDARAAIENALGGPVEQFFSDVEPLPIGVGSIGQVHRARLRAQGAEVVVKLKRPRVDADFRRDLALFNVVARLFQHLGISRQMRWTEMSKELTRMVSDELDFRLEADAALRMHKNLLCHAVYAPKVFLRYCTSTTVVLEYIDGVKMTDYLLVNEADPVRAARWCAENRIERGRVAYRLYASLQRQIFEDNLFHGDLHPGNILLLRNSRFALIDFGAVGALDGTFRKQLNLYNALIAEGSYMKAAEVYLEISSPLPALSNAQIWKLMTAIANHQRNFALRTRAKTIPHNQKASVEEDRELARVAGRYRVPFSWQWLKLQRTLYALDASLYTLDPKADPIKFGIRYRAAAARRQSERTKAIPIGTRLSDLLTSATTVAGRLDENLAVASQVMRRVAIVSEPPLVFAMRSFLRMVFGIALIVACAVLLGLAGHPGSLIIGGTGDVIERRPGLKILFWVLAAVGARMVYVALRDVRALLAR